MLSRKYYNEIAKILKDCGSKEEITEELTQYFKEDNPNFSTSKFNNAVFG